MRFFLFLLIFFPCFSFSQNGLTSYPMPAGYTNAQLRYKNALAIDNTGNKWVAFRDIGLGKFDGTNWTVYDTLNSQIPSKRITSIAVDAANNIWVGTFAKGAAKFDGTNWTVFDISNSSILNDSINSVSVNGNNVWIGTVKGISKFNGLTFTNYSTSNSGLVNNTVQCFAFETNGNAWIGTKNGLSKLNGTTWTTYDTSNSGLKNQNILSLYADGNAIWMGTMGGGVHRLLGNTIENINTIFPTGAFTYPAYVYSICKGQNNGVVFSGVGFILEVTDKPAIYYMIIGEGYITYENSTGLFWFVNRTYYGGNSYNLFSFDSQNYNGFGLGLTYDNFKYLDINEVKAAMLNRGDMHWNPGNASHGEYEVPKGSGVHAIFASAFWMGGFDSLDSLHVAGLEYHQSGDDFWPGPLDTTNGTIDTVTSMKYDKIWKIDRYKVEEFKYYFSLGMVQNGQYIPDNDFVTWPARGTGNYSRDLAPFIDANGNGIYDPLTGGDYPSIKGDQMLYWIFNDNLTTHKATKGTPLKIEVHASAYAFTCSNIPDSMMTLNYTTLYNFKIINRSGLQYDSVYVGKWQDSDLGCASDDYVGCYPAGNYSYYYNGINNDPNCSGELGYGLNPPMLSTLTLNGPPANPNDSIDNNNNGTIDETGEKNLMTHFVYITGGAPSGYGDPANAQEYYNYLSGSWGNGNPVCYGGLGYPPYSTLTPAAFCYPDFPYDTAGWNEITAGATPDDRRDLTSCGPFTLPAGASVNFDWAIVWSRDTTLPFMSKAFFDKNLHDNQKIQAWFAADNFPSCLQLNMSMNEENQNANPLEIFPNPSSDFINVNYKSQTKNLQFEIIDVMGRQVFSLLPIAIGTAVNIPQQIDISKLSQGLYLLKVRDGELQFVKRFVKSSP